MKYKPEETRREVIKEILARDSIDHLDALCLAVRFHTTAETISEDIRQVRAKQEEETRARVRAEVQAKERAAELAQARKILRGEV
jgi:hypothetical protein